MFVKTYKNHGLLGNDACTLSFFDFATSIKIIIGCGALFATRTRLAVRHPATVQAPRRGRRPVGVRTSFAPPCEGRTLSPG